MLMALRVKRKITTISTPKIPTKTKKVTRSKKRKVDPVCDIDMELGSHSSLLDGKFPDKFSDPSGGVSLTTMKALLQEQSKSIISNANQRFDELDSKITGQNEKITELETEIHSLKTSQAQLTLENEFLWKEVLRNNLVFSGLKDSNDETRDDTKMIIQDLLKSVSGKNIDFDIAYRVGNFSNDRNRPIKVKFFSTSQTEEILANKRIFRAPIYVNPDLPRMTRRDHAVLRHHKKKLISEGTDPSEIKIEWDKKKMRVRDLAFSVIDGKIKRNVHGSPVINNKKAQSSTSQSKTRLSNGTGQQDSMDFSSSSSKSQTNFLWTSM